MNAPEAVVDDRLVSLPPPGGGSRLPSVRRLLEGRGLPWALFAGAAARVYGAPRAPTDIDLVVPPEDMETVARLLPQAEVRRRGDLVDRILWVDVDICRLLLDPVSADGHPLALDAAMRGRLRHTRCGNWLLPVVPVEDNLAFKLTLARGADAGKHDLEDARAMLRHHGQELDRAYLRRRARQIGALERINRSLRLLGLQELG